MAPKQEIITSLELWQIASKFQRQIRNFRWWRAQQNICQVIATTIDHQKLQDFLFTVVGRCRNLPESVSSRSAWSKTPDLPLEFRCYLLQFQWYNYFRFWWPYRYFRLSIDVIVTCWHFLPARPGRKPQVCRQSCSDICHTVGDISTSGLDGHVAISVVVAFICGHFLWVWRGRKLCLPR